MASRDIVVDDEAGENEPSKNKNVLERAPGRSLLPVARVQKILKADKELDGVAKEAVFLISVATM